MFYQFIENLSRRIMEWAIRKQIDKDIFDLDQIEAIILNNVKKNHPKRNSTLKIAMRND